MNVNKYLITKYNQQILITSVSLSVACMRIYCYFFISLDATDNQVNSGVYVYETLTYSQKHRKDLPVLYTVAIEATPSRTSLTLLLQGNIKCHSFGLLLI